LIRNPRKTLTLTTDRAAHVLNILISEGKLTAKQVSDALRRREALIADLRQRLAALEQGAASAMKRVGRGMARKAARKPKRKMTVARRAALRLHGQYLGTVRPLSKANRAKVKAIRAKSGARAAIAAAKKMAK